MNNKLFKSTLVLLIGLFLSQNVFAQVKKLDDSGKKPHWVSWGRGKDFKHLGKGRANKLKLDDDDEVYLFVSSATEVANNGKTDLFTLDDAKSMCALNASKEVAAILKTKIDAAVKNDVQITEDSRQRVVTRTEKMINAAKFSGFVRVGSYWEKYLDKESGKTYWEVNYLYSMNRKILEENLEKAMLQLDIPEKTSEVMSAIETASDEVDDEDLGDF